MPMSEIRHSDGRRKLGGSPLRIRRTAHAHIADAVVALHKIKRKNRSRQRRTAKATRRP